MRTCVRRLKRISRGGMSCSSAACTCRRRRSATSHDAPGLPAGRRCWAGRRYRRRRKCIRTSTICTWARSAMPPTSSLPVWIAALRRRTRRCALPQRSGCPYRCEFCDIPALYGRQPRLKSPPQLIAELDSIVAQRAHPGLVYFVDDNFIGNRKATREILPHLVAWQKKNGYPLRFACEATLNLAKQTEILALMREAQFQTVFVGIETPEADALKAMRKEQNATLPMMEAIATLNSYGLEFTSGIILGLYTDTADTEARLKQFIDLSNIPVLTINLLQALPKTPLWERLARDGRIVEDASLESNVRFLRPYDEVVEMWRRCIAYAYDPERLFARLAYQVDATYANRMEAPVRGRLKAANLRQGATLAVNLLLRVGWWSDYRRAFWSAARRALQRGQIDAALSMGFVAHHLIQFAREAIRGEQNASFYSMRTREEAVLQPTHTRRRMEPAALVDARDQTR